MKVDIFDFDLDRSLIADKPASPRDSSKLLDLSEEDRITDRVFCELPEILHEGDVLVFNDTKVIPARLYGKRGEAQVEVTLYHPVDGIRWQSFIKMPNVCAPATRLLFTPPRSRPKNRILPPKSWKKTAKTAFCSNSTATRKISAITWKNTVQCRCRLISNAKNPPMACGANITTKKIIRPSMPDTKVPLPHRPPACILPRASWRLWIKRRQKGFPDPACRRRNFPAGQSRRHQRP